jgi:RNA polymerase sigma-70 factor (ECF subfamily)
VVDAFSAAARDGDFDALLAVLDPDVVLRSDGGILRPEVSREIHGAVAVAAQALIFEGLVPFAHPALVNGGVGAVVAPGGEPFAVLGFTVRRRKIVEIDIVADPERLANLDLGVLDD